MSKHTRLHVQALDDRLTPSFSPATSYPVGGSPQEVVTGDFNGDGHLDVATLNLVDEISYSRGTVSVLLGDGAGGFGAAINSDIGANLYTNDPYLAWFSLTVADFDNDDNDDLAMAIAFQNTVTGEFGGAAGVSMSNGDGTFGAVTYPPFHYAVDSVASGDFNNDGNSDLVVTGYAPSLSAGEFYGYAEVLLGSGQGGFANPPYVTSFDGSYYELAVGDLNGDGKLDAVGMAGQYGGRGIALLGNGGASGAFSNYYEFYTTSYSSRDVAVGDLTGDGIPDVVVAGQTVDVLPGLGNGTFAAPLSNPTNGNPPRTVTVADFNGDAKLDVITTAPGSVSVLLGQGNGTLSPATVLPAGSSVGAVAVGNFNGDKRPDVAIVNYGTVNTVGVLLNDGKWGGPSPARVTAVTINGGAVQRSRVTTMTIDFDQIVNLPANPANAFQLKRHIDSAPVALTATVVTDSATHVTLSFGGAVTEFGSLKDGRYDLTVLASKVSNTNGSLDGDYNGTGGDNFVLVGSPTTAPKLFRFFGDADGNGIVNQTDFVQFRNAFNNGPSAIFDFDGNGSVTQSDFIQFRNRFNLSP